MAKLEALNINPRQGTSDIGTSSTLHSPVLSPSSPTASSVFLGGTDQLNGSKTGTESNKAVTEWLADVRGKFEAFDEYLGIVGAGMPRHYLVDEEDDDAGSSDGNSNMDEEEQNGDYDITVEPADPSGVQPSPNGATRTLRHTPSASSLDSNNTGRNPRKKISSGEKSALVPDPATPFGMFEHLNSKANRDREASVGPEGDDSIPGIANNEYFQASIKPGSVSKRLLEQHQPPHILARGLISPVEAEKLFQIYFDKMNLSVSLLDPVLYTAQRTYFRSPFLFTVICAIASRFYSERPGLYLEAMRYAQLAAGTALISGKKNVEMCQAYILMSLYPVPAKKWEDQRSWLYLGLAIRCATDLNLHIPNTAKPINETHAREMLNRTRVWLNCYNLDRSTGSQYGKPPIISNADYVANHSENWWQSSQYNLKHFDVHLCAYNAELKVLAGFLSKIYNNPNNPIGLNKDANFEQIATETDDELQQLGRKWFTLIEETDLSDPQNSFRTGLLRLAYSYARLSCLSFGFQHAFGKNHVRENPFLHRCLNAARDVVNAVVNDICRPSQLQYWRHGPEAQSVFVTFASAFLVKLLQPKFAAYLSQEERVEIRNLVQQVVDLLASPEIAIDDRHGPKLYSRFLSGLLAAPMAKIEPTTPAIPPGSSKFAQQTHSAQQSPQILKSALERTPTPELPSVPSVIGNGRNHTLVPPRGQSMSPTPTQDAVSFSIFAPQGQGVIDPYANIYQGSSTFDLNSYDPFFFPPLPGDSEMVDDMQALTDPNANRWAEGQEIQGFNWMTTFQRNFDLDMQASGVSVLYNNGNLNGTQKYAS
ncbi:hypothetical protein AX16_002392 [Volvariella volvacea WC 439]|nr:hypothetical protein AX16_002392 [Volvariella volvacea WC 439]